MLNQKNLIGARCSNVKSYEVKPCARIYRHRARELRKMKKPSTISNIREVYHRGENVLEFLKNNREGWNDWESIMISYDFQAGTYTRQAAENSEHIERFTDALVDVWADLGHWQSAIEVGVGEATLQLPLMAKLDPEGTRDVLGFDVSWSRSRYARNNAEKSQQRVRIFVANLFEIPLPDNSVDIVYTSHSLEPNGGREAEALTELCRVARRFVVLLEPDYGAASDEGKARMERHGYVRDLGQHARDLGHEVIEERPFGVSINPLNPTGLTIIRKPYSTFVPPEFVCPVTKTQLLRRDEIFFGPESGLLYPIIDGLPCLLESSATLGLHFETFNRS